MPPSEMSTTKGVLYASVGNKLGIQVPATMSRGGQATPHPNPSPGFRWTHPTAAHWEPCLSASPSDSQMLPQTAIELVKATCVSSLPEPGVYRGREGTSADNGGPLFTRPIYRPTDRPKNIVHFAF